MAVRSTGNWNWPYVKHFRWITLHFSAMAQLVIYDTAHAFGIQEEEGSILHHGNISMILARRSVLDRNYRHALSCVQGIRFVDRREPPMANYGYFPMLVEPGFPLSRDELYIELRKAGVNARRYFYPLVSNLPIYKDLASSAKERLPVANRIADQVLCLPIYPTMTDAQQARVIDIILNFVGCR